MKVKLLTCMTASFLLLGLAHARPPAKPARRAPASATTAGVGGRSGMLMSGGEAQKPLKVQGQSRNLNMMLVLKSDKDKIQFAKPRVNYRDKVPETPY
jgi:hypothetical protein